ncbi:MAG: DUF3727 domain-containing protein [Elainellaceae cyanobacterium]
MASDPSMNPTQDEFDASEAPVVTLQEDGRSLKCYVEQSVDVDGTEYALLLPVDISIEIFAWEASEEDEEEEVLVDVDDSEIDKIFDTARAVLAEQELTLYRSALTLTVSGELPEADEEELITLELEDDADGMTAEQLQFITSFFYEEQEYAVYSPLDPLLFFARVLPDGSPKLLSPEEFQAVRPHLENVLFDDVD